MIAHFSPGGWLATFWAVQLWAGLIPLLAATLALGTWIRAGQRRRWARPLLYGLLAPLALLMVGAQGLAMWALQQRPPAIAMTADAVWCAPWRESVAWIHASWLGGYDKKLTSIRKELGFTVERNLAATESDDLRPAAYDSWPLRWGIALAMGRLEAWGAGAELYPCDASGLDVEMDRIVRTAQELQQRLRAGAADRERQRCIVDWCAAHKPAFAFECVAQPEAECYDVWYTDEKEACLRRIFEGCLAGE